MSPGDVLIVMFYGRPKNVNLTHSITNLPITFLKYSFSVPPGSKNSWIYPMFHKLVRTSTKCGKKISVG